MNRGKRAENLKSCKDREKIYQAEIHGLLTTKDKQNTKVLSQNKKLNKAEKKRQRLIKWLFSVSAVAVLELVVLMLLI